MKEILTKDSKDIFIVCGLARILQAFVSLTSFPPAPSIYKFIEGDLPEIEKKCSLADCLLWPVKPLFGPLLDRVTRFILRFHDSLSKLTF